MALVVGKVPNTFSFNTFSWIICVTRPTVVRISRAPDAHSLRVALPDLSLESQKLTIELLIMIDSMVSSECSYILSKAGVSFHILTTTLAAKIPKVLTQEDRCILIARERA